ncbi:MAG: tripartite tricarboxylate transporter substrate-binding protein, partial [Betaproteobacteria bacterium]
IMKRHGFTVLGRNVSECYGRTNVLVGEVKRNIIAEQLAALRGGRLPGFDVSSWYGVFAPGGTSRAVVDVINAGIAKAVAQPDVAAKLGYLGADPYPLPVEEFTALVRRDQERWLKLIKERNLKMD